MSVLDHLRARAATTPAATLLVDRTGDWSAARLWSRVQQLADQLVAVGAQRVSSTLDNGG